MLHTLKEDALSLTHMLMLKLLHKDNDDSTLGHLKSDDHSSQQHACCNAIKCMQTGLVVRPEQSCPAGSAVCNGVPNGVLVPASVSFVKGHVFSLNKKRAFSNSILAEAQPFLCRRSSQLSMCLPFVC